MSRRRTALLVALVLPVAGLVTPLAAAKAAPPPAVRCIDGSDAAHRFVVPVGSEEATGFYTLPARPPVGIVAFSHGYGHSSFSWQEHMARVSRELNVITVAMDGRGLRTVGVKAGGVPDTRGWPVVTGAEDAIAATQLFEAGCPTARTIVNYGVSMGGNTSGIALLLHPTRRDGRTPLFDWWIDVEGVTDLTYLYTAARAAGGVSATARNAAVDIEEAMGGPLERFPERYHAASPGQRPLRLSRSGVKGVVTVHGLDDGLVSPHQEAQLRAGLLAAQVPVQSFTVVTKDDRSERDTSITGTFLTYLDPAYRSPAAGHGSERSTVHLVIRTGFERLTALFRGHTPSCTRAHVVDGQLETTVPAPGPC